LGICKYLRSVVYYFYQHYETLPNLTYLNLYQTLT
jgi:hypothetical protein